MSDERDSGTASETTRVERVTESYQKGYETLQRNYSAVSSSAEEQPPVPWEDGLFAAIPVWNSPAASQPDTEE
jgi:hypothetical protein